MNKVIVETDCQEVQMAMEGTDHDITGFGVIIFKGRSLLLDQPHKKVAFVWKWGIQLLMSWHDDL
ncbi:hypothetical protein LINPERHAP1_LOCUS26140 [Linum perenne]